MPALIAIVVRIITGLLLSILAAIGLYKVLPPEVQVHVPFTSQAPEGVWTEPWQNACEEASIIMLDNFYKGSVLTREAAQTEILKIFDFKEEKFGPSKDESMQTVASIINESYLNWEASVIDEPSITEIKTELASQRPVIAPVYAQALNNPYYDRGGPDYHVVVITGYDDDSSEFITHDPGTQHGEHFRYNYQELYDAINDFLTEEDYTAGPTRVIFTSERTRPIR